MSQGEDSGEKSHEPSQKKLDDARKKGEVPRSVDLTTAAAYGGLLLALLIFGAASVQSTGTALMVLLGQADALATDTFSGSARPLFGALLLRLGGALAPLFAIPAALALLCVIAQRALVFAPSKLEPKLSRISPLSNAKNKFGRAGLFEFFKSFAKLVLYSAVLGFYLSHQLPRIMTVLYLGPGLAAAELARLTVSLLALVLLVALVLGALDFVWQRAEHLRKHRMSRKEMTDEFKESEGDPAMKQQRRQKAVTIAMNQMMADVPRADVVIVNPTHFAVALQWDRTSLGAPICVAKGVDAVAARIREIATLNAVPIHSDPPTARALHASVEIGEEIRPDHYQAVAAAIRFAEAMRDKVRRR